jgi:hypothetical protein
LVIADGRAGFPRAAHFSPADLWFKKKPLVTLTSGDRAHNFVRNEIVAPRPRSALITEPEAICEEPASEES